MSITNHRSTVMISDVLIRDLDTDYTLREEHNFVWVTVGKLSIYIKRNDEGVSVDIYPVGGETEESLASTYAYFSEAIDGNEEEKTEAN